MLDAREEAEAWAKLHEMKTLANAVNVVLAHTLVQRANGLLQSHPKLRADIQRLLETRVPCSEATANHHTIQAQENADGSPSFGFMGLLNGLVGVGDDGAPYIAWDGRDAGPIDRFVVMSNNTPVPEVPGGWVKRPMPERYQLVAAYIRARASKAEDGSETRAALLRCADGVDEAKFTDHRALSNHFYEHVKAASDMDARQAIAEVMAESLGGMDVMAFESGELDEFLAASVKP